jgi:hypothetical protein
LVEVNPHVEQVLHSLACIMQEQLPTLVIQADFNAIMKGV